MAATYEPTIRNFKLLAHHTLDGFGGMGEGMSIQIAKDGRRILWLAHESAPKNFTAVDVSDPRSAQDRRADRPAAARTCAPTRWRRSATSWRWPTRCRSTGRSRRASSCSTSRCRSSPKSIAFVDASGPGSRGVHQLWFCDGETVHMAAGAPDFTATNPLDDQFYRAFDVRNPVQARGGEPLVDAGHARRATAAPPPMRHKPPRYDMGFRAHNTNVYPQRPDRLYLGYIDGGMFILDISDRANPKPLCRWDNSPPFSGFTHTVLPLFERELLIVTDESVVDDAKDWPKLIWILDGREETNPVPIATCPVADVEDYARRGGRFGAHNIHENVPLPTSWHSDRYILGTFFNGGLRAYDIADPYRPEEVAVFVPPAPKGAPTGAIQLNDVFVDERQIVYAVDRHIGGLYVLEMGF